MTLPQESGLFSVLHLSDEENKIFEKARAYQTMLQTAGWKHLTEFLSLSVDAPLARLRSRDSVDPTLVYGMTLRWLERDGYAAMIEQEIQGTIETRNRIARDILTALGKNEEEIQHYIRSL